MVAEAADGILPGCSLGNDSDRNVAASNAHNAGDPPGAGKDEQQGSSEERQLVARERGPEREARPAVAGRNRDLESALGDRTVVAPGDTGLMTL